MIHLLSTVTMFSTFHHLLIEVHKSVPHFTTCSFSRYLIMCYFAMHSICSINESQAKAKLREVSRNPEPPPVYVPGVNFRVKTK